MGYGIHPMPVGDEGMVMTDVVIRGKKIAALDLLRREQAAQPLPINPVALKLSPEQIAPPSGPTCSLVSCV